MPQTMTAEEFFGQGGAIQPDPVSAEEFFGTSRAEQNFFERFGEDIRKRFGEQGAEIIRRRVAEDQDFASTALQLTGKVGAGTILDFIGEAIVSGGRGLSAITPDFIEDPLKENATKAGIFLLETELGQKGLEAARQGIDKWQEFSEEHPTAAANIESIVNIGFLVAPVKGKPKTSVPGPVGRAGAAVGRSGRRSAVQNRRAFIESLVMPKQTAKVRREQVARTVEKGLFRQKVVALTPQQTRSAREVAKVSGVSNGKTLQGNYNAIAAAVERKANGLQKSLDAMGTRGSYFANEFESVIRNNVTAKLRQNPALVGNAEQSAQRVIDMALRIAKEEKRTLGGLLRTRKRLDGWVRAHKPKALEDGAVHNAMTSAVREVRKEINGFINARSGSIPVKNSLSSQSSLLRAMDDLAVKAGDEASSAIKRAVQNAIKVIPIRNELVAGMSLVFGLGGLGAAAAFMPFVQTMLLTAGIVYGGRRAIMAPATRKGLGKIIEYVDLAMRRSTDPNVIRQLRADKAALIELAKETKGNIEDAE